MVGISAPSSADALLALVDFVQKPEYQERLKVLKAAEEAANSAQLSAQDAIDAAVAAQTAARAELERLADLKQRLEGLPAKERKLKEWIERIQEAIASKEV